MDQKNHFTLFRVRSWENGMCCIFCFVILYKYIVFIHIYSGEISTCSNLIRISMQMPIHKPYYVLTHWGRDKMAVIFQTTFSSGFSWTKMYEFRLKFHWSLFLRVQLTIFQHWFRYWLGAGQATSHFLNQWWLIYRRIYASLGLNELTTLVGYTMSCSRHDATRTYISLSFI